MRGNHLGELEELVLLAVLGLDQQAYGVSVQQQIEQRTGRVVTLGAVYSALQRLERKGYLLSRVGPPGTDRGGRRKRLFTIRQAGRASLEQVRADRAAMWQAAEPRDA